MKALRLDSCRAFVLLIYGFKPSKKEAKEKAKKKKKARERKG